MAALDFARAPRLISEDDLSTAQKEQLANLRRKLEEADNALAKWSARFEAAVDKGNDKEKDDAKEQQGIYLSRVRDLEGQLQSKLGAKSAFRDRTHCRTRRPQSRVQTCLPSCCSTT
jgi:hypothetical protein